VGRTQRGSTRAVRSDRPRGRGPSDRGAHGGPEPHPRRSPRAQPAAHAQRWPHPLVLRHTNRRAPAEVHDLREPGGGAGGLLALPRALLARRAPAGRDAGTHPLPPARVARAARHGPDGTQAALERTPGTMRRFVFAAATVLASAAFTLGAVELA